MFSARVPGVGSNRVARVLAARRTEGRTLVDLTVSNPTRVGFSYPPELLRPLADADSLRYDPAPLGMVAAREAVAEHLSARGIRVAPDRVVLTASTSEAYALLFKLLCDPADVVLVPQPSYPLFEHLTRLEGVVASPYALEYHGRWELNIASVRRAIEPRARAVLLVNPNNPTGSFVAPTELAAVRAIAAEHDLAVISDEVFDLYSLDDAVTGTAGALVDDSEVLTFTLGGLSKSALLPQVKLGWILVGGPPTLARRALARLEFIADTYLSVATPVQHAVGPLLARTRPLAIQVRDRVRANAEALRGLVDRFPACQVLQAEAGWYAVVQVPALLSEEALVINLIEKDGVLVHPGYFYDFPREAFLVVSLLGEPAPFATAMHRVLARASG